MTERTEAILSEVRRAGDIAIPDLAVRTGASEVTIRRALTTLADQGLIIRTRGRAQTPGPVLYEALRDSGFQEHALHMAAEKRRIGLAAAGLLTSGEVVAFGPGTTTTATACSIPPELPIRVITNAVNIAMELYRRPQARVYLTGGDLRPGWFSLVGQAAAEAMRDTIPDKAIIGVTGINVEQGLTDDHRDEAAITRIMMTQARQRIVVADHTKFGRTGHTRVWPLEKTDIIVTDSGISSRKLAPYEARGVRIIRV
jgi:DeoR family transcriptional regulator of aga operon